MYLMGLVNSTLMTKRPTGHVELIDLSVEKAKERFKEHMDLSNGHLRDTFRGYGYWNSEMEDLKPSASPRSRNSPEGQPADLYMEPLFPLFLGSPSSDSSEGEPSLGAEKHRMHTLRDTKAMRCNLREDATVNVKGNNLNNGQELDQESSLRTDKQADKVEAEQPMADMTTTTSQVKTHSKNRLASKQGSVFAEHGITTRVQHHPLQMIEEEHDRPSNASTRTRTRVATGGSSGRSSERSMGNVNVESPPKINGAFARVQQHPLESIEEDSVKESVKERRFTTRNGGHGAVPPQRPPRKIVRDVKPDRAEGNSAKERKFTPKKGGQGAVPSRQKIVRGVKPDISKQEREKSRENGAPITIPRSSNSECENADAKDQEKLSLSSPVMEKMEGGESPETPHSWNKKFQKLPKLAVGSLDSEPLMEERDLRYSSPKMTDSDVQDELSFRVWERESTPKRKSISVSRDFSDLDLDADNEFSKENDTKSARAKKAIANSCDSLGQDEAKEGVKIAPQQLFPPNFEAFVSLSTFDLRQRRATPNVDVNTRSCEEELQRECPSPSSFTCGLSPTSLFSDDDNIFSRFSSSGLREGLSPFGNKSPRSVLSQEPDEISHFISDSSETRENRPQYATTSTLLDTDESSDLESTMNEINTQTGFKRRSFPTFTYGGKEVEETSSDEDPDKARDDTTLVDEDVADISELRYFQEAEHREPWLEKNGGVLDDTDLDFLLPPDFKDDDTTSAPDAHEENSEQTRGESPGRSQGQNGWVPYVIGQAQGNDIPAPIPVPVCSPAKGVSMRGHRKSSSFSKNVEKQLNPQRPPKRSVKFAPEIVKDTLISTPIHHNRKSIRLPKVPNAEREPNVKVDDDEHIYPSVKSWEVGEEDQPSTPRSSRSSRLWTRRPRDETESSSPPDQTKNSPRWEAEDHEGPPILTSRRRWRRSRDEKLASSPRGSSTRSSTVWSADYEPTHRRRDRIVQILPCAGKLFAWPQRITLKVSRNRSRLESDEESSIVGDESFGFGRSARRDAQQVRRILKGRQKQFSDLTVADILTENFGEK